jgi:hypothetical protein
MSTMTINVDWVAAWSLVAAIGSFLLRQTYLDWLASRTKRKEKPKFLLALLVEIQLNNEEPRQIKSKFPRAAQLLQFLKEGRGDRGGARPEQARREELHPAPVEAICHRPLIVHYYLDFVFKGNAGILTSMPDALIRSVIQYYGKLETVSEQADAIALASFSDVSVNSRLELLTSIRTHLVEAYQLGDSITGQIRLLIDPAARL